MSRKPVRNIVCISDTHFGSTIALCQRHRLADGGWYEPSALQTALWHYWQDFWEWTYERLDGASFILVHNGDVIDGVHHGVTALSSHNLADQSRLAINALEQHVGRAVRYYQIKGTEAHAGKSAQEEEAIAEALGAVPDTKTGQFSRWFMRMHFGDDLIHFAHHIGTTTSTAYQSSAVMREITASFTKAGQWGKHPPTILIRSHRHQYIEVKPPKCRAVVTPGWQATTPLGHKMDRMNTPEFGGLLIRQGSEGTHIRERLYTIQDDKPEEA